MSASRPSWHDLEPSPKDGDVIICGPLTIIVGQHNGVFRSISIEDHLMRPIALGDVPYRALRQIEEASEAGLDLSEGWDGLALAIAALTAPPSTRLRNLLSDIRGACTDEADHREIDRLASRALDLLAEPE